MFWKIVAVLFATSPAVAETYGPWSPAQAETIQRAAVVLATSSACRNITPFSEDRATHAAVATSMMRDAGLPAEELMGEFIPRLEAAEPIGSEPFADVVCRVVLGNL